MRPHAPQPKYTRTLDRYQVSHELGRGGMAVVYLARQIELDRWVALKELRADDRDPSAVRRFLRESRLAGSLAHPNIVTVIDFFEADDKGYIAMEYVPHGSLRRFVGNLSFAQVAGVLEGVLAALSCAERQGIVHRDVKPENVMVTREGRVKLTDFGIAKPTGAASMLTAAGTTLGTPHYMAPEQALAQPVGPWTDLYSVGCMAYELVTGRLPFGDTDAPTAILLRHINETPIPASFFGADPRLSDWIETLMAKAPEARPQSAAEAWETLEELALSAEGPRWRRASALPTHGTEQIPGPYTPPPSQAIFETFHEPPPSGPTTDPGAPTAVPPGGAASLGGAAPLGAATALGGATPPGGAAALGGATALGGAAPLGGATPPGAAAPLGGGAAAAATLPPRAPLAAAAPATARPRPRGRRPLALALALLLVVAGAVAVLLFRGEAPPPTPSPKQAVVAPPVSLQAGRVKVELPSTWRPLSLPIDVPGLPRDGAAAPNGQESGGVVLVGMAPKDAHRRALLSPRLGESTPEAVTLGRLDAYRHAGLSWNGRALTVYAVPTSKGVATVACLAPVQPGDCRRIAESLVVDGATAFPLGPDPRFAKTTALKLPSRSLQARTAAGQAKAARRVAADYRSAHGRLARVKAGPADEPLVRSLRHRLTAAADAFQALARAADSNDRGAYAKAAKRARAAESGLRHTVRASVYRGTLEPPRAHAIPALRRPPTVVTPQAPHTEQPEQTKPSPQQPQRPGPSKPQPPRCTGTACGGKPAPKPTNPDFGGGEG